LVNRIVYIIFITILLTLVVFAITKNQPEELSVNQQSTTISAQIEAVDGQLIDVRTPDEYLVDHANGAINVPLDNILNGDLSKINKAKPVYVYCRSGNRAGQAKIALEKSGYRNVTNLGGISDWQKQGGLVCSSAEISCKN